MSAAAAASATIDQPASSADISSPTWSLKTGDCMVELTSGPVDRIIPSAPADLASPAAVDGETPQLSAPSRRAQVLWTTGLNKPLQHQRSDTEGR